MDNDNDKKEIKKRQREEDVAIVYISTFGDAYVQTRHKNIRCFPMCCPMHMDKSFCGRIIEVLVTFPSLDTNGVLLLGEFNCVSLPTTYQIGDEVEINDIRNGTGKIVEGELISSNEEGHRFVINPNRKWFYPRTNFDAELHWFTVYLAEKSRIIAYLDSKPFRILPVWKEDKIKRTNPTETQQALETQANNGQSNREPVLPRTKRVSITAATALPPSGGPPSESHASSAMPATPSTQILAQIPVPSFQQPVLMQTSLYQVDDASNGPFVPQSMLLYPPIIHHPSQSQPHGMGHISSAFRRPLGPSAAAPRPLQYAQFSSSSGASMFHNPMVYPIMSYPTQSAVQQQPQHHPLNIRYLYPVVPQRLPLRVHPSESGTIIIDNNNYHQR